MLLSAAPAQGCRAPGQSCSLPDVATPGAPPALPSSPPAPSPRAGAVLGAVPALGPGLGLLGTGAAPAAALEGRDLLQQQVALREGRSAGQGAAGGCRYHILHPGHGNHLHMHRGEYPSTAGAVRSSEPLLGSWCTQLMSQNVRRATRTLTGPSAAAPGQHQLCLWVRAELALLEDGDKSCCPPRAGPSGGVSDGARLQGGFQLHQDGLLTRAWLLLGWVGSCQHDTVLRQRPELFQLLHVWLFASCAPFSPIGGVGWCKVCQPQPGSWCWGWDALLGRI